MTVFRWIMAVIAAILATGSVVCFVLFITLDIDLWIQRARGFRRGTYLACLTWFNVEVWGRVIWTIIHW